jgi:tRNA (guanine-N7-)-methyltransferase
MGKNKLAKFAEMEQFPHVVQVASHEIRAGKPFPMKGRWNELFFKNNNPIVLELGCGKGEYTVALAGQNPDCNFIGIDIKGARMWTGAKASHERGLANVGFLRTNIEMIAHFFGPSEVQEIWLTFPDPQMKKVTKRLTATNFLSNYGEFLKPGGLIHLKTDSPFMFTYTRAMVELNGLPIVAVHTDVHDLSPPDPVLSIQTYYEQQWIERGLTIKYISFILDHTQNLLEPDIEIEPDSYRSFGRSKQHN